MPEHAIYHVIAHIPPGKVLTYGQVAQMAGLGRGARQVGRTLKYLPPGSLLPWHRVVNSRGTLSLPPESSSHALQKEKLQQEGIVFNKDRINLKVYSWMPDSGIQPSSPGNSPSEF